MNFGNRNAGQALKSGVGDSPLTPSAVLLKQRLGASPAPRMLTPYEIGLLRRSKGEMGRIVGKALAAHSCEGGSAESPGVKEK